MLTAKRLIELKALVKAEMARRKYYGDLSKFADSSYDFSTTPKKGGKILAEHGKKVIEPLLNIADKGDLNIDGIVAGGKIPNSFDDSLIEYVNTLANERVTGSSSSCRGACSGLCTETCGSACTGCSSSCSGSCGSGCSKTCGSGCGSCTTTCSSCSNACSGCSGCSGCGSGCSGGCNGCSGCGGNCSGCSGGCGSSCGGCSGGFEKKQS